MTLITKTNDRGVEEIAPNLNQQTTRRAHTTVKPNISRVYRNAFRKVLLYTKIVGTLIFLLTCVGIGFIINEYLETHTFEWQAPVIVRTPLLIERVKIFMTNPEASASATPAPENQSAIERLKNRPKTSPTTEGFSLIKKAYANESDLSIINRQSQNVTLQKIYQKESQSGLKDSCKFDAQGKPTGKFNGFGYAVHGSVHSCYDSFEEVVGLVNQWFIDRINEGYTVAESYCYYNEGIRKPDCPYYQSILDL